MMANHSFRSHRLDAKPLPESYENELSHNLFLRQGRSLKLRLMEYGFVTAASPKPPLDTFEASPERIKSAYVARMWLLRSILYPPRTGTSAPTAQSALAEQQQSAQIQAN